MNTEDTITEKDLVELGFDSTYIPKEENEEGRSIYWYHYELCDGFDLISCANDEVEDSVWFVTPDDHITNDLIFTTVKDLKEFIAIFSRNTRPL